MCPKVTKVQRKPETHMKKHGGECLDRDERRESEVISLGGQYKT